MLQIKNLNFSYKNQSILKNVNMLVQQGEIIALIGPNGSGKSTLLRCLNGFLQPNNGQVLFKGEDIRLKTRKWISCHIALLPQNLETIQHTTIYDLVAMGRSPYLKFGWFLGEEDKKIVEEVIEYMNLQAIRDRPLSKISGGERQRAWIAMILAQNTEIVLLDEPITFLDLKYQWLLLDIIKQVRRQYQKTFILVLHDINQAMTVADNFVVLKEGNVRAYGKPRDIITSHLLHDVYDVAATVCSIGKDECSVVLPAKIS
ncbi:ABC transporter ATP-binding protein [Petroclostridium sp. X23]|uniref:ABC transporter ATP-binding protein n=1 Tax=Petroclostridium sp. X23 TaxID=3045146 RepID=UPI0024AE36FB|nr:ABC transporter ATP-binding protein [Petroclostridium sp. X23]WHH60994.1 ABC transporter ATP-binding protein [Petroclostridium sp. X23]